MFVIGDHMTCECDTVVDDKYEGPRLEDKISAEFMQDLMEHFKDQKKLHQKYAFKVSSGCG